MYIHMYRILLRKLMGHLLSQSFEVTVSKECSRVWVIVESCYHVVETSEHREAGCISVESTRVLYQLSELQQDAWSLIIYFGPAVSRCCFIDVLRGSYVK